MEKIKVSVIVPVYNVEKYLEECVDSLIGQTLKEIEILLIDDGSTDSSGELCDRYAQQYENIHVIHKTNGGLGDARNVGASEAIGKYIYFIDSDDYLELEALEFLYKEAETKQLDLIMFSAESFSDDSDINFNANDYKRTQFLNEIKAGKELFRELYSVGEYYASIPLRFYNRKFFVDKEYTFPAIIHEDEFPAFLSLIEAQRVECVSYQFYKRRYRKGSIMTSEKAYKSAMGYVDTWKALMNICKDSNLKDRNVYFEFTQKFLKLVINLYYSAFDKKEQSEFQKVRKEIRSILGQDYKKLEKGMQLFLNMPYIYGSYKRVLVLKSKLCLSRKRIRQFLIFCDSVIRPYIVRIICKDKSCVILIGTPIHGNLGDQAIVYAEQKFFERFKKKINIIEISSKLYLGHKKTYEKVISKDDLIIIDGGGSMGTLWIGNEYRFRDIIKRFPENRIFIFPQTAYFEQDEMGKKELKKSIEVYSEHKNLTIFCRDQRTYEFIRKTFRKNTSYYIPDMVFSLDELINISKKRNGVLVCLREDVERLIDKNTHEKLEKIFKKKDIKCKNTSTLTGGYIDKFNRHQELEKKWTEFSGAQLVITDRLHAMIFCAITGTPCIALDNVSHKVRGGYEWIQHLPYISFSETGEISEQIIQKLLDYKETKESICLQSKYEELQRIVESGGVNEY